MGLVAFIKEAGAFLFGHSAGNPAPVSAASQLTVDVLQKQAAAVGVAVDNLAIELKDGTATVHGSVVNQADREKLILAIGNTPGVAQVDDLLVVNAPSAAQGSGQPAATLYTVKRGDTLWSIAERHYGAGRRYKRIYAANRRRVRSAHWIEPCQRIYLPRPSRRS